MAEKQPQLRQEPDVVSLARKLAPLTHGSLALSILRDAMAGMKTKDKQSFLNRHMLCSPIQYEGVAAVTTPPPDAFNTLQGDIIRTEVAYHMGVRLIGNPSFVIMTSTCDLIPGRRHAALILQVELKTLTGYQGNIQRATSDIGNLVNFKSTQYLYLPPLDDDDPDVLFNVIHLDRVAQCATSDLDLAERRASMSVIGWRVFGALIRELYVREAEGEATIRGASTAP